ncbi:hypothetical protein [Fodinibius halophilus]|uniref:Flagellar protein FliT n=1 Tax=Fodinibius halophilus TaxID=1736908 RepID=A0A6M1T2B3_9BACT|nr:hypothetical protein [Fodinibius halophilus]NGP87365.1 hypothetical protein [Fodinibius halophilus]
MESLVYHLREMIKINTEMLVKLHKDDISVEYLREAFDNRGMHVQKVNEIVPTMDKEALSDEESASLKKLFDKFNRQGEKIQKTLDEVTQQSQDKLTDAVQRRKAEDGYRVLK